MKSLKYLLILSVTFAAGACNNVNSQEQPRAPSFQGLGDIPGGETYSVAYDVSADGEIVVGDSRDADDYHAFRWEDGAMAALPVVSEYAGRPTSAGGVSPDGSVVVGRSGRPDNSMAMRWEGSEMVFLGRFSDHTDAPNYALAASAGGGVVVGWELGEAFRWEAGAISRLGEFPGGGGCFSADDISPDGSVIVGTGGDDSPQGAFKSKAFVIVDGVTTPLGILGIANDDVNSEMSSARAVTPDGAVVVGFSSYSGADERHEYQPFRWESGEMAGLGFLPGHSNGQAEEVSADGSIVVGWTMPGTDHANNPKTAFIWTEAGGMRDLKGVLESDHGLDLTGWTLTAAYGISHDGAVIVGAGVNPAGDREGWRAVLGSR